MLIGGINSSGSNSKLAGLGGATAGPGMTAGNFSEMVSRLLQDASDAGHRADVQAQSAALGKANVVDVVTAVAENEMALQTLVAIRDRTVSAYEEVMRMQI